jgi:hypothetical protein
MYICKKKAMVKAFTLSDKIVQMGYNDFESVVGQVFKQEFGSGAVLSSTEELASAGATQIEVGQVVSFFLDTSGDDNSFNILSDVYLASSPLVTKLFSTWTGGVGDVQWVQIRSLGIIDVIYDSTPADPPLGIVYKIVADAFTSVVAP